MVKVTNPTTIPEAPPPASTEREASVARPAERELTHLVMTCEALLVTRELKPRYGPS